MFGLGKNDKNAKREVSRADDERMQELADTGEDVLDVYDIDPDNTDRFTKVLIGSLEKAVSVQAGVITKYVERLQKKSTDPEKVQALIDGHFLKLTTGTGAGAGAASSVPGIGLVTGIAAIGAESLVFLEAAAWYILASAYLRGVDIHDKEERRALVLLVLTGSKGTALVDTLVGDFNAGKGLTSAATLSRFSAPQLTGVNKRLTRLFTKQVNKRLKWGWVSKLMPLGIGAVLGSTANRKLAKKVIRVAHDELGEIPATIDA